jgi:hypothetical protein
MATITDLSVILSDLKTSKNALPLMNKAKKLLKEMGHDKDLYNGISKPNLIELLESLVNDTDKLDNGTDNPTYPIATEYASGQGKQLFFVDSDTLAPMENGQICGEAIPKALYEQMVALGMLSKWQPIQAQAPKVIVIESKKDWAKVPCQYFKDTNGTIGECLLGELGDPDTSPAIASDIDDKSVSYPDYHGQDLVKKLASFAYHNDLINLGQYAQLLGIKPIKGKKCSSGITKGALTADQKYKRYRAALVKAKLECQAPSFQALLDKMANGGISMAELKAFQSNYDMKKTHINSITSHLGAMPTMGYSKQGDWLTLESSQIPMD